MAKHLVSIDFDGKEYSLETGRFAKFASGAVMVRCGDTMVLVTAVASTKELPEIDYLPLQVEYREKIASAGKIPGGFLKREGRPSEKEILSARLIDRPIRPMITKAWKYDTQVVATVFSAEPAVNPDTLAAVGASAALMLSDIPFHGPISEVRVGRIDGEFVVNPSVEQLELSEIDMTVAGTDTSIVMVEGESKEITEDVFVLALEFAHTKIKELNNLQKQLFELAAKPKREVNDDTPPEELVALIKATISEELHSYVHTVTTKSERTDKRIKLGEMAAEKVKEAHADATEDELKKLLKITDAIISKLEKASMRQMILDDNIRLDGRGLIQIRPINCEVGLLPRTHGSALFTRGETQSLTTVTLGTKSDEQMVDGLMPLYTNRFLLHYNFPPFSTGETGRMTGTSRREIGHGNLAERALKIVTPEQADFPYTIRIVSDILESNGSSSMATVCAGSLALFNAGVPMKKAVAGIAMGLILEGDKFAVLSDILGDEDFLGDMDFKVTGTGEGITACQMDIKIEGLSLEIMKTALNQAKEGRLHILSIMNETLPSVSEELSPYAPRFTIIQIPQDKIGAVIGSGGENIRAITRETGTEINIEDNGTVTISATSAEAAAEAQKRIEASFRSPERGEIYKGEIKEIKEGLGAIVEFLPKTKGLLHISEISRDRVENVSDVLRVGDKVEVMLVDMTYDGKYRLSIKALTMTPEELEEARERNAQREQRSGGDRRDSRGGGYNRDRGGDRGGRR